MVSLSPCSFCCRPSRWRSPCSSIHRVRTGITGRLARTRAAPRPTDVLRTAARSRSACFAARSASLSPLALQGSCFEHFRLLRWFVSRRGAAVRRISMPITRRHRRRRHDARRRHAERRACPVVVLCELTGGRHLNSSVPPRRSMQATFARYPHQDDRDGSPCAPEASSSLVDQQADAAVIPGETCMPRVRVSRTCDFGAMTPNGRFVTG